MAFSLTTRQFNDGTKDVTRRAGWATLKPGDRFLAVERVMGFKRGEKSVVLGLCVCLSNDPEPLGHVVVNPVRGERSEVAREGFPDLTPAEFVAMVCREVELRPHALIRRIAFARVPAVAIEAAA